jgi:hypothetical protein
VIFVLAFGSHHTPGSVPTSWAAIRRLDQV